MIICQTSERGEIVGQVGMWDLFLQQVCFVEEEDEVGLLETGVGDNSPEQSFALLQSILRGSET